MSEQTAVSAKEQTDRIGYDKAKKYRQIIKENIEYDILSMRNERDIAMLDEIVDLMTETVCTRKSSLVIAGDTFPSAIVKSKLLKLNSEHIEYVIDCMNENTTDIRNIKKYLLAVLFNAPSTIDSYYREKVNHDMANYHSDTDVKHNYTGSKSICHAKRTMFGNVIDICRT